MFVNLGSDHPSIIEAMVKGQSERKDTFPKIYTCPNEVFVSNLPGLYLVSIRWLRSQWLMAMPD